MLVLSRKRNEEIRIGDALRITVIRVGDGRVRLGIDAPADVPIIRGELEPIDTAECENHPQLAAAA